MNRFIFIIEIGVLAISALVTVSLNYFKIPVVIFQQLISVLIVLLVALLNKSLFAQSNSKSTKNLKWALLGLVSFLVQVTVVSSGGFFSPFLILVHIFALGAGFLVNFKVSLSFLIFSLLVLLANIFFDTNGAILVKQDFGSVLLYMLSFVITVPIVKVISQQYRVTDTISKLLAGQVNLDRSILEGIKDIVFVTDLNLKLISINDTAQSVLSLDSQSLKKASLLEILSLKDQNNQPVPKDFFPLDEIISKHQTRIMTNLFIYAKKATVPKKVSLQIRPVSSLEGQVNQLVFVFSETDLDLKDKFHQDLDQARHQHQLTLDQLRRSAVNIPDNLRAQLEIFNKINEDLILALELEDHPIKEQSSYQDIAAICQNIVDQKQSFARSLGVQLSFVLPPTELAEMSLLKLIAQNHTPSQALTTSGYSVPIDIKWLNIVIQKLLDIGIIIGSAQKDSAVTLVANRTVNNSQIDLAINFISPLLTPEEQSSLLIKYYGSLVNKTNLSHSSGLEGYIAQTIATHLNIPLTIKFTEPNHLHLILNISKKPRILT